jgi:TorA maturation chaperone TorD
MTDRGLQEAIRAAGGVTELARRIGIAQPSVSNWSRIPAERVLSVEAITGVAREVLRPDLYAGAHAAEDIDVARAHEYALLATLLLRAPTKELLTRIGDLRGDATPLGFAHIELAAAARDADVRTIEREFFEVFIGIGRGELLPYGSYYLTGFLHERPLARLRQDMAEIGIDRADGIVEPEDHAGILCEIMSGLASGELFAAPGADRKIFEKHMAPWIGRFFTDLERVQASDFYRRVGTVGRLFIEIETSAFALSELAHSGND